MTIEMIECENCKTFFQASSNNPLICSGCCKDNPALAHRARVAAQCRPPSPKKEIPLQGVDAGWDPEDEQWFHKKSEEYEHTL